MKLVDALRRKRNRKQPLIDLELDVIVGTAVVESSEVAMPYAVEESNKVATLSRDLLAPVPPIVHIPYPERHVIFEWPDVRQRITVRPTGIGQFQMENGPFVGEIKGCACITISSFITIKHGPDETLRINIDGVCEIKYAKSFSIVERDESIDGPIQIQGASAGVLHVRAGTSRIEITGDEATVLPARTIEVEERLAIPARFAAAG